MCLGWQERIRWPWKVTILACGEWGTGFSQPPARRDAELAKHLARKKIVREATESDSMGQIEVPAHVYWGAQTQRSLLHFNIGRDTMPPELIRAFGVLKKACALVNQDLGKLHADKAT